MAHRRVLVPSQTLFTMATTGRSATSVFFRSSISLVRICAPTKPAWRGQHSSAEGAQSQKSETTHFGFKTVAAEEKSGLVGEVIIHLQRRFPFLQNTHKALQVFHKVANTYDLMNDVMSAGIHRCVKKKFYFGVFGLLNHGYAVQGCGRTSLCRCCNHYQARAYWMSQEALETLRSVAWTT